MKTIENFKVLTGNELHHCLQNNVCFCNLRGILLKRMVMSYTTLIHLWMM